MLLLKPIFKNPFLFHFEIYNFYIKNIKHFKLTELYHLFNDIGQVFNIQIIDSNHYNQKYAIVSLTKFRETSYAQIFKENLEKNAYYKRCYKYYVNNQTYLSVYKNKSHIKYKTIKYSSNKELQILKERYNTKSNNLVKFKRENISPSPEPSSIIDQCGCLTSRNEQYHNKKTPIKICPELGVLSPCLDSLSDGELSDTDEFILI
jgi:hypothetical protein